MGNGFSKVTLPDFSYVAPADATFVKRTFISPADEQMLQKTMQRHFKEVCDYKKELSASNEKHNSIKNIIANDPAAPKNLNKDKMADMIMKASAETGVDPVIIASIAKKETHFTQNVPTGNGSGIMQITSISLKDMYLRPQIYDKNMKQLIKKYGSWEKVVQAKKKDPSMQLGNFGELLYKYGNSDKLREAVRKDPQINITLGAYLFKAKLDQAGGNVQKALQNYNGSSSKLAYAKTVMQYIDAAKTTSKFDGVVA